MNAINTPMRNIHPSVLTAGDEVWVPIHCEARRATITDIDIQSGSLAVTGIIEGIGSSHLEFDEIYGCRKTCLEEMRDGFTFALGQITRQLESL